jgi:hypothetical protein
VRTPTKSLVFPWFPEALFNRLAPLPGKCLAVYQLLVLWARLQQTQTICLTTHQCQRASLTRREKQRALHQLEQAGLITVTRQHGKNPRVTVLALDETGKWGEVICATQFFGNPMRANFSLLEGKNAYSCLGVEEREEDDEVDHLYRLRHDVCRQ